MGREHAEFAGYFIMLVTQPGWTRFAGFVSEFLLPCGLDSFDGYEFVAHVLVAMGLRLVMYLRSGSRHELALAANTGFIVLYGIGVLIFSIYSGNFFRCPHP